MSNKGNKKNKKANKSNNNLPRVSICTPTFNRRPFFKGIITCVMSQTYPKELLDDDSDDFTDDCSGACSGFADGWSSFSSH